MERVADIDLTSGTMIMSGLKTFVLESTTASIGLYPRAIIGRPVRTGLMDESVATSKPHTSVRGSSTVIIHHSITGVGAGLRNVE